MQSQPTVAASVRRFQQPPCQTGLCSRNNGLQQGIGLAPRDQRKNCLDLL